jgi:N6-L-threonylcarbamoyladenine synthase
VKDFLVMEVLGQTLDDAAGEAFDKTGKLLGLEYPAGPVIDRLAQKGKPVFDFPEPQIAGLNFSFSGLKTSILFFLRNKTKENPGFIQENLENICASVQSRIVSILLRKLQKAARLTGIREIAIAGGVSANTTLRSELEKMGQEEGWNTYIPGFEFCTDNAAMIAVAGYYKFLKGEFAGQDATPAARYEF